MTNEELAQKILDIVGPVDNVISAETCMTRLRITVRKATFTKEQLAAVDGVLGINKTDNEWQLVFGPGKAQAMTRTFNELLKKKAGEPAQSTAQSSGNFIDLSKNAQVGDGEALHNAIRKKNATPFKLLLKQIAHIFVPLIPAFIGCGLITAIVSICLKINPDLASSTTIQILAIAGNAIFWGLNLFIGFNAAKEFGGSPILGGVLAAIMTHPGLANITVNGSTLVPSRGGVIAVLLITFFAAKFEQKLHKIIPGMFDLLLTPLIVILVFTFAALFIFQPVGGVLSEYIGEAATNAIAKGGAFTGFILGGIWLPMVMLGIHQGMTPIHADLLATYGFTILLPVLAMAGGGQVGAAFAVYMKTKNARLKTTVASALPIGIMGVGEPLIYGVTLPLGKPFLGACIGGAFGGAVQAAFAVGATTMGISGLPLTAVTTNMPIYFLGLVVSYIVGFIATWILGFDDPQT
jgi:PTS system sucrose-specific IIC component